MDQHKDICLMFLLFSNLVPCFFETYCAISRNLLYYLTNFKNRGTPSQSVHTTITPHHKDNNNVALFMKIHKGGIFQVHYINLLTNKLLNLTNLTSWYNNK